MLDHEDQEIQGTPAKGCCYGRKESNSREEEFSIDEKQSSASGSLYGTSEECHSAREERQEVGR